MKASINVASDIDRSFRVQQIEGMFDVAPSKRSQKQWSVDLPVEERDWQIGLICGPSGCGKSTIARKMFGEHLVNGYDWPAGKSVLDGFDAKLGIKDITKALSSVGLSSPPSWLRPFAVLSNGEQFRVSMARLLCEERELAVFDEFTSVVDRTVAQIGSAAISKAVRRSEKKFVAVTCHMDVEEWLDPDWVYLPHEERFYWRLHRQRPPIELVINRVPHTLWRVFKHHHYLTADLNKGAFCAAAFYRGSPVAFDAWLPFVGRLTGTKKARRGHRTVVLPDYQGVGIGRHLFDYNASMFAGLGYRAFSGTGHPAEIASRQRSGNWRCTRAPSFSRAGNHRVDKTRALDRLRASFEWCGAPMEKLRAESCFGAYAR